MNSPPETNMELVDFIDRNSGDTRELVRMGVVLRERAIYVWAGRCFDAATQASETDDEAWLLLGHSLLLQNKEDRAFSAFDNALDLSVGLLTIENEATSSARVRNTLISFLCIEERTPQYHRLHEVYFYLGILYRKNAHENLADAEGYFEHIYTTGRYTNSITIVDVCFQLGLVFELDNKPAEAIQKYREALDHNPQHIGALENCAPLLYNLGDYVTSKSYLENLETAGRLNSMTLALFGDIKSSAGDTDGAIEYYRRSVQDDPSNGGVWADLGELYELIQRPLDALEAYRDGILHDPGNVTLHNRIQGVDPDTMGDLANLLGSNNLEDD